MKKFLAVYTGTPASVEKKGWNAMTEVQRKEREKQGMEAWKKWGGT
ncbi:MAG: hypothetical protein ACRETO_05090 [Gammaproteobacteria bacterium]